MALPPVCSKPPRVVIVGAGMAGIAAVHRLQQQAGSRMKLTILEACDRIGGRVWSTEFNGERVELGATWIHGIEGSPVFEIAQRIGAMEGGDGHSECKDECAWECQDGFSNNVQVQAEGGLVLSADLVEPVVDLFRQLLHEAQTPRELEIAPETVGAGAGSMKISQSTNCTSVGAFLRQGLNKFLAQTETRETKLAGVGSWNESSLQEGVFRAHENLERNITAADSLYDLDLDEYNDYYEIPGEHKTIQKGYLSVLLELASHLPEGTIQLGKKVKRIVWSDSAPSSKDSPVVVHCEDGSIVEADHVIVTASLGVLKEHALPPTLFSLDHGHDDEGNPAFKWSSASESPGPVVQTPTAGLFSPPLPKWKLHSISCLGFGTVDKVFLQFDPAEDVVKHKSSLLVFHSNPLGQATANVPAWMRNTFSIYPIHEDSHVLLLWFAGSQALETELLSDDEIVKGISDTLAIFGVPLGTHRGIIRSKWGRNPLSLGSYSYVKVGSSGKDFDSLAEPLPKPGDDKIELGVPHPLQILFAGEATHRHYYSTTHGAYFSGIREADRLLRHYGFSG